MLLAAGAVISRAVWAGFKSLFMPDVPRVTSADLIRGMSSRGIPEYSIHDNRMILLVDVRGARESAVSMIPGAVTRVEYEENRGDYANRRIVPYCTIGYRSAKYTRDLIRRGVDAANFEAGIMAWAESGLPLVTPDGETTTRIHTWSRLIRAPRGLIQVLD